MSCLIMTIAISLLVADTEELRTIFINIFSYFQAVLVKVNKITNEWARGIVSKYNSNTSSPEIYLIDTQVFDYIV